MISFEFAEAPGLADPGLRVHCARLLAACLTLAPANDASGGRTGMLARKGIVSTRGASLATRDMIFVIGVALVWRTLPDGRRAPSEQIDYRLNGHRFRLITAYVARPGHSWTSYPPERIVHLAAVPDIVDEARSIEGGPSPRAALANAPRLVPSPVVI